MARNLRHERQLLDAQELLLVEKTYAPILKGLSDRDVTTLLVLARKRRDRSRKMLERQRREMRGKAKPKGARPATDNTGTRGKRDLLDAAVQRLNDEASRRKAKAATRSLRQNAKHALELRRAKERVAHPSAGRTASPGKRPKNSAPKKSPRNPAKLGAISQHTKNMQAKRDARTGRAT